jgi:hypothetical protein
MSGRSSASNNDGSSGDESAEGTPRVGSALQTLRKSAARRQLAAASRSLAAVPEEDDSNNDSAGAGAGAGARAARGSPARTTTRRARGRSKSPRRAAAAAAAAAAPAPAAAAAAPALMRAIPNNAWRDFERQQFLARMAAAARPAAAAAAAAAPARPAKKARKTSKNRHIRRLIGVSSNYPTPNNYFRAKRALTKAAKGPSALNLYRNFFSAPNYKQQRLFNKAKKTYKKRYNASTPAPAVNYEAMWAAAFQRGINAQAADAAAAAANRRREQSERYFREKERELVALVNRNLREADANFRAIEEKIRQRNAAGRPLPEGTRAHYFTARDTLERGERALQEARRAIPYSPNRERFLEEANAALIKSIVASRKCANKDHLNFELYPNSNDE